MSKRVEKYTGDILSEILAEISPEQQRKTDKRMLLAVKIKDGMNAKGWRNKHLAKALNQHQSVITKWLSGTHNFTSDTLFDLEEVLGIRLIDIEGKNEFQITHYHLSIFSVTSDDQSEIFTTYKSQLDPHSFANTKQLTLC